jgi:hypothetical protein
VTGLQRLRVVPAADTWYLVLTFTILTDTFCRTETSDLDTNSSFPMKAFRLSSMGLMAALGTPLVALSQPSHTQLEPPSCWLD